MKKVFFFLALLPLFVACTNEENDDNIVIPRDNNQSNTVVSKAKYQQYGSMQRSDGMTMQFGYAETCAALVDNKLMVVSGQFVSTDMMDRQTFSRLMTAFREKTPF